MIVEGSISVKAAIQAEKRDVHHIYIDDSKQTRDIHYIQGLAEKRNIPLSLVSLETIEEKAQGHTHGGVIAEVGGRHYQTIEETLSENPFIVLLEGIEDPFNLGYVIRTLYSAGCTGLLLKKRDWSFSEPTILKSSAGALEYLPIVLCEDMSKTMQFYKANGLTCYAAMRKDAISFWQADYRQPCLIAIGGEMRGLSKSVLEECDQNIYIPYANDFHNALNGASATAVLAFEVVRQRQEEIKV